MSMKPSSNGSIASIIPGRNSTGLESAAAPTDRPSAGTTMTRRRRCIGLSLLDFHNSTELSGAKLETMYLDSLNGWSVGRLSVRIRYSRGADFSGTCIYADRRIYINLGRHLVYPYGMKTNLAKVKTIGRGWRRPIYVVELKNAY